MYQYTRYPYNNRRNFLKSFSKVTILTELKMRGTSSCRIAGQIKIHRRSLTRSRLHPRIAALPGQHFADEIESDAETRFCADLFRPVKPLKDSALFFFPDAASPVFDLHAKKRFPGAKPDVYPGSGWRIFHRIIQYICQRFHRPLSVGVAENPIGCFFFSMLLHVPPTVQR